MAACSVAPRVEDRAAFASDAQSAMSWFEKHVPRLHERIDTSAGYAIFPNVLQWGTLVGGGSFGRGTVNRPDGSQIGWGMLNNASIGLQAGMQDFKMLVVFENERIFQRYQRNRFDGSVAGIAVAFDSAVGEKTSFADGVTVYQAGNAGLIAGVNIGLDLFRFQPVNDSNSSDEELETRSVPIL